MRILLWHGYLLGGTGLERLHAGARAGVEPRRARRDGRLPGARTRSSTTSGARRSCGRSCPDGLLPVFVLDRYEGLEARLLQDFTADERAALRRRERRARCASSLPADLVFTNHVLMGGAGRRRDAASASASRRTAPSSSTRCAAGRSSRRWGRETLARAEASYVGSAHIREVLEEVVGPRRARGRGAAGRRRRRVRAAGARRGARRAASTEARADPPNPGNANERLPDEGNAERLEAFLADDGPTVVYFGKLIEQQGRPPAARGARRARRARGDRRLRRLPRTSSRRRAPPSGCSSRGRSSTATSCTCCRSPTSPSCRRSSPRRSGWSPPRPPPPAARRSSHATPASPRSPRGSRRRTRRGCATWRRSERATPPSCAAKLSELLALAAGRPRRRCGGRRGGRRRALVVGGRGRAVARPASRSLRAAMGEEQRLSPEEQLATARAAFESGTDFTLAVEEEFALLDPETLGLTNRFEELKAAAARHRARAAPRRRADRVRGRGANGQVRRLRRGGGDDGRAPSAAAGARPRARGRARRAPARTRGAAGRTSGSSTRRTTAATTSSSATSSGATTPSGSTSTSASAAATARSPSATRCATTCPSCSRSRRARRSSRRSTAVCTRRGRRSSRACSPAAGSRTPTTAGRGSRTTSPSSTGRGSIDEHTQLWWSVRPHLAYPTVEIRICDAQPDLAESQALAALAYALAARCARALDEGEPLPDLPHRLLEENFWRAIRYGLPGELIDFDRGEPVPARARIEQLIEWVAPVAEETGAAPFLPCPRRTRPSGSGAVARWGDARGDLCNGRSRR